MENIYLHSYLNAPRLRIDMWNILASLTNQAHYENDQEKSLNLDKEIKRCLDVLKPIESYNAFPGPKLFDKIETFFLKRETDSLYELVSLIVLAMRSSNCDYKAFLKSLISEDIEHKDFVHLLEKPQRHYFEVLVVEDVSSSRRESLLKELESYFLPSDSFEYELIFVNSFQDALIAIMFNFHIKACLISDFFKVDTNPEVPFFQNILHQAHIIDHEEDRVESTYPAEKLANTIRNLRQREIDLYYLSSYELEKSASWMLDSFDRVFYDFENYYELHLVIMQGIKDRYEAPFFDSLKKYTFQPKSAFHALPLARGKSIFKSRWIQDMSEFYGKNIFLAESSSTAGGLDSLLNPSGSIKKAMKKASAYFGSHESFFVTNGTSSSNKIVLQALLKPGDIVLLEHNCHESHHYGLILIGAFPIFLNGYPIDSVDIDGPIPLQVIKDQLLLLKKQGKLDQVKLLILTNCTFDGLVYNVQKYMEELLAIKPDLIFFWDEAWFAYGRCVPHYRLRTGMFSAKALDTKYKGQKYREDYEKHKLSLELQEKQGIPTIPLLPDPDLVKVCVYTTQSIHKTLSSFRQGSMIHVYDHEFDSVRESFTHAFVTHSTTSPNYQIIATMDLARRQADLEGFELVQNAIELSMIFRQQVNQNPLISRYFQALGPSELIPEEFRQSKVTSGYVAHKDWGTVEKAWKYDDIVVDPTRVTLKIKGKIDGYQLRHLLMDRFGIQVNKVSRKSILLQFNIGTLRSSVSYLLGCLLDIVKELEDKDVFEPLSLEFPKNETEHFLHPPEFSSFSAEFLSYEGVAAGDLRKAYFAGLKPQATEVLSFQEIIRRIDAGEEVVCASIIIPVPPGYPALLPGQVVTKKIIEYLHLIDPATVLAGYSVSNGLKVFKLRPT